MLEKRDLFTQAHSDNGKYNSRAHIAEMIALLGPARKELINREQEGLGWRFKPEVDNPEGKSCGTASESMEAPSLIPRVNPINSSHQPKEMLANPHSR